MSQATIKPTGGAIGIRKSTQATAARIHNRIQAPDTINNLTNDQFLRACTNLRI